MSTEQTATLVLREAAAKIRKDQDINEQLGRIYTSEFNAWLAVADWLTACASVMEVAPNRHRGLALAVATAYLDRSRPGLGTAGVTGAQPDEPASQAGRPASGAAR